MSVSLQATMRAMVGGSAQAEPAKKTRFHKKSQSRTQRQMENNHTDHGKTTTPFQPPPPIHFLHPRRAIIPPYQTTVGPISAFNYRLYILTPMFRPLLTQLSALCSLLISPILPIPQKNLFSKISEHHENK